MKKLLLIIAVCLMHEAKAQENRFELSIENGISKSTLSNHFHRYIDEYEQSKKSDLKYMSGIHASYNINNIISIGIGAFRVSKSESVKLSADFYDINGNFIRKSSGVYTEIYSIVKYPLYLKISTPTKLKAFVEVGGYYGYSLGAYSVYKDDAYSGSTKTDYASNGEMGIHTKIGVAYPIVKRLKVSIGLGYDRGLNSVSAGSAALLINDVNNDVKTQTLSTTFGVSYLFCFKE